MDLELFQAYASQTAPRLLDQTGVYVVQPNGLQRRLNNVYKLGKGQLQSRFRIYKKMWADGGKVFAFFTVPTPSAVWAMQRDVPLAREQQLIGVGHGLLRHKRYHGEWIDAPLLEILCAMQQVHKPSEGRFYVCDPSGVRPVFLDNGVTRPCSSHAESRRSATLSWRARAGISRVSWRPRSACTCSRCRGTSANCSGRASQVVSGRSTAAYS